MCIAIAICNPLFHPSCFPVIGCDCGMQGSKTGNTWPCADFHSRFRMAYFTFYNYRLRVTLQFWVLQFWWRSLQQYKLLTSHRKADCLTAVKVCSQGHCYKYMHTESHIDPNRVSFERSKHLLCDCEGEGQWLMWESTHYVLLKLFCRYVEGLLRFTG